MGHLHPVFCYNNNELKICIFKLLTSIYNYFIKEKIPVTFGPMFTITGKGTRVTCSARVLRVSSSLEKAGDED